MMLAPRSETTMEVPFKEEKARKIDDTKEYSASSTKTYVVLS